MSQRPAALTMDQAPSVPFTCVYMYSFLPTALRDRHCFQYSSYELKTQAWKDELKPGAWRWQLAAESRQRVLLVGESGRRLGHSEGETTEEVFTELRGLRQILARWCLLKGNTCPTKRKKVRARTTWNDKVKTASVLKRMGLITWWLGRNKEEEKS